MDMESDENEEDDTSNDLRDSGQITPRLVRNSIISNRSLKRVNMVGQRGSLKYGSDRSSIGSRFSENQLNNDTLQSHSSFDGSIGTSTTNSHHNDLKVVNSDLNILSYLEDGARHSMASFDDIKLNVPDENVPEATKIATIKSIHSFIPPANRPTRKIIKDGSESKFDSGHLSSGNVTSSTSFRKDRPVSQRKRPPPNLAPVRVPDHVNQDTKEDTEPKARSRRAPPPRVPIASQSSSNLKHISSHTNVLASAASFLNLKVLGIKTSEASTALQSTAIQTSHNAPTNHNVMASSAHDLLPRVHELQEEDVDQQRRRRPPPPPRAPIHSTNEHKGLNRNGSFLQSFSGSFWKPSENKLSAISLSTVAKETSPSPIESKPEPSTSAAINALDRLESGFSLAEINSETSKMDGPKRPPPPPRTPISSSNNVHKESKGLLKSNSFLKSFGGSFIGSPIEKDKVMSVDADSPASSTLNIHALGSFTKENYPTDHQLQRLQRQHSALPRTYTTALDSEPILYPGEEVDDDKHVAQLDCGPSVSHPILSYERTLRIKAFNHAGYLFRNEKGDYSFKEHDLFCDFGSFEDPISAVYNNDLEEKDLGVLASYGIGIMLWFKFLKAYTLVFFVMFLCSLPSLYFYCSGTYFPYDQRMYQLNTDPLNLLVTTTLGNLGTSSDLCYTVESNQDVLLSCQSGVIVGITAYYGHPTGQCKCPSTQQPLSKKCPGDIVKSTNGHQDTCSKNLYGEPYGCFYGDLEFDYSAVSQPCCATKSVHGSVPDFDDLKIQANYTCNSRTAQYIAEGVCLGRSSCVLGSDPKHKYSWSYDEVANPLPAGVCMPEKTLIYRTNNCTTSLGFDGVWDGCNDGEKQWTNRKLTVMAVCEERSEPATLSKHNIVIIASAINAITMLIFLLSTMWILKEQLKEVALMDKNTCRAVDYTVQLDIIPPYTSIKKLAKTLKRHFEDTLTSAKPCFLPGKVKIADINFTTGSFEYLQAAIQRGHAARELDLILYRKEVALMMKENTRSASYQWLLRREVHETNNYEKWNTICQSNICHKVIRAYITFETEEGYCRCLSTYPPSYFASTNSDLLLESEGSVTKLHVTPAEDPSDILWENLGTPGYSKVIRRTLTLLLLVCLLLVTYTVVNRAILRGANTDQEYPSNVFCGDFTVNTMFNNMNATSGSYINYGSVVRDVKWEYYNNSNGRQGYLQCYCEKIYNEDGMEMLLSYLFYDPEIKQYDTWCKHMIYAYARLMAIRVVVAFVIVCVNVSSKTILRTLRDFERRESNTEIETALTYKLFFVQVVNTGMLSLLMNGKIKGIPETETVKFLNSTYSDFSSSWYADVGKGLIVTMVLYILGVHALKIAMVIYVKWTQWHDRYYTSDFRLTRMVIQEQLDRLHVGPAFMMEVRYASVLTIIYICVSYSCAMPIMHLIACAGFFIMYWIDKYFFLRFNRLPSALSSDLPIMVTRSLYAAVLINLAISIWSFSNVLLFHPVITTESSFVTYQNKVFYENKLSLKSLGTLSDRLFNDYTAASWIILVPAGVFVFITYLFSLFENYRIGTFLFSAQGVEKHIYQGDPEYFHGIPEDLLRSRIEDKVVKKHIYERYKKRYDEVLKDPNKREDKQLDGLESYDICLNYNYADKYALNSQYIQKKRPLDLFDKKDYAANSANGVESNAAKQPNSQGIGYQLSKAGLFSSRRFSSEMSSPTGLMENQSNPMKNGNKPRRMSQLPSFSIPRNRNIEMNHNGSFGYTNVGNVDNLSSGLKNHNDFHEQRMNYGNNQNMTRMERQYRTQQTYSNLSHSNGVPYDAVQQRLFQLFTSSFDESKEDMELGRQASVAEDDDVEEDDRRASVIRDVSELF